MPDPVPDFKTGDKLLASHLQAMKDEMRRGSQIRGGGRVQTRRNKGGGASVAYVEGVTRSLGKSSGAITARSGVIPGTGTVNFYWKDDSGNLVVTDQSETVNNPGDAISTDKWVWCEMDSFGDWYVSPLECE
jgi:hypothetical protein